VRSPQLWEADAQAEGQDPASLQLLSYDDSTLSIDAVDLKD
jgi:hypothetical protein